MNNENNNFNSNNSYYNEPDSNSYSNNNSNFNYSMTQEDAKLLKKWNWGAFMFNICWGIGNKCYMPLLCLIPLVNIVMIFVCGAYGNRWLWATGQFKTPRELFNVQRSWNTAGYVYFIISIIITVIYILIFIFALSSGHTSSYSYTRGHF